MGKGGPHCRRHLPNTATFVTKGGGVATMLKVDIRWSCIMENGVNQVIIISRHSALSLLFFGVLISNDLCVVVCIQYRNTILKNTSILTQLMNILRRLVDESV